MKLCITQLGYRCWLAILEAKVYHDYSPTIEIQAPAEAFTNLTEQLKREKLLYACQTG